MRTVGGIALSALLVLGVGAKGEAQDVASARRLYLEADFRASADEFEAVLAQPSLDAARAAEAHRYLAALRSMLRSPDAARAHAAAAVALDPTIEPPEGAPPETEAMFEEARREFGGATATLAITAEGSPAPGAPLEVQATVAPSPDRLLSRIELRCVSGDAEANERGPAPAVTLTFEPASDEVHCRAAARTSGGATLLSARESFGGGGGGGGVAIIGTETGEDDDEGGSPWPWIAVGGAAVAAAAVVAVVLLTGSSSSDTAMLGAPRVEGW